MSKIQTDKINYEEKEIVIKVESPSDESLRLIQNFQNEFEEAIVNTPKQNDKNEAKSIIEEANIQKDAIILQAKKEANEIIEKAKLEAKEYKEKNLNEAESEIQNYIQTSKERANKEAQDLIDKSKDEIEQERVKTINDSYKEGWEDGNKKIAEELEEKITFFDELCKKEVSIRDKIIKAASKDIINIIETISKKILLKELDSASLEKIIKKTISLLETKEKVNIILSEKYAKMLYELQKKSLSEEIDFEFENYTQYEGFDISYSPNFKEDTIIIENYKERLDASITSQLDILVRNIFEEKETKKLDLDEYIDNNETE